MATVFENIGFNISDEDGAYKLADFVLNSGSILPADRGVYACWSDKSGAEIWERLALNHEEKSVSLLNIDPHFNGSTAWHLEFAEEFSGERDDILDCKARLKLPDSESFVCARIMGALAAEGLECGSEYDFQVSMIPHSISFYENESAMRKATADEVSALGALIPLGMYSRLLASDGSLSGTDILLTRVSAEIESGDVRFMIAGKKPVGEFLHLVIKTHLGNLDIAVSQNQYETAMLPHLCEGGMVVCTDGIISAKLIRKNK